jgi:hypothetical protein
MKHLARSILGLVLLAAMLIGAVPADADVAVRGYTRRDGTYIAPHYRSSPNSTRSDNWSVYPNVNPYTGKHGTRDPLPYGKLYGNNPFKSYTPRCTYSYCGC